MCMANFVIADYCLHLNKEDSFDHRLSIHGPTILNITSHESINLSVYYNSVTYNYNNITNYSHYYHMKCNLGDYVSVSITSNANNNTVAISTTKYIGCSWISIHWVNGCLILLVAGFMGCVFCIAGMGIVLHICDVYYSNEIKTTAP